MESNIYNRSDYGSVLIYGSVQSIQPRNQRKGASPASVDSSTQSGLTSLASIWNQGIIRLGIRHCSFKQGCQGGGRTIFKPQYKTLINTSIGALHTRRTFLTANRRIDKNTSAARPTRFVSVAMQRPMMVKYWKCHPYASLL